MSYFGKGWASRQAPQPRWQATRDGAGQYDEDEEHGGMYRAAHGRYGQEQGRNRGYGTFDSFRGLAERQRQEQEQGMAWDHGQDTREGWARGRQQQMGPRGGPPAGERGGGGPRLTFGEGWHDDPMGRNSSIQQPVGLGANDAMDEMRRRRVEQAVRSQGEQQRPKGKTRKGPQQHTGQGHGLQESKYGSKKAQKGSFGPSKAKRAPLRAGRRVGPRTARVGT